MTVFDELKERGLIAQTSDEEGVRDLVNSGKAVFYVGFDATADSLHAGHFLMLTVIRHLQKAGNLPILLVGGGTTMVGDPSGRTDMRKMLSKDDIIRYGENFVKQFGIMVDLSEGKAIVDNNANWLCNLNYIDFLRDIGVHFSVNRMLAAECFKSRLEKGLSFIEFNYMLMQSYDFLVLNEKYGCTLQMGGDDQWSNILMGADLIRRKTSKEAYALTYTLLLNSEGNKMGKTTSGAVWLDAAKTSPFEFYQYWRNVNDADVIRFMKMLTFIPLDRIAEYAKLEGSELNSAKEALAYELTSMVHGKPEAEAAQTSAHALFSTGASGEMPETTLESSDLADRQIALPDLMVKCGLCPSKGEARRLITQGGVEIDGTKVSDFAYFISADALAGEGIIIKKGKKVFHRAKIG